MKTDYSDIAKVLVMINKAQEAETDQREKVREAKRFITQRNGQWDEYAYNKMDGRFRGTFDMCTPIIDGIAGEIEEADFTIRVSPASGNASNETAKTLDGLIRNIRNISSAEDVFATVGRSNVIGGFDAVEVVQDWVDGDSFDQDLFIRRIPNAVDSVWFDPDSVEQDRSDAQWCVKLISISTDEYNDRFPEGSGLSVGDDARYTNKTTRRDLVTIGKCYYKKPRSIEIVRMTDGSIYKVDENFEKVSDELAQAGITIELDEKGNEKRRTKKSWRVYSRLFDGGDWLTEEEETVFDYLPIVPIYGNFDIVDNEVVYFGKIENLYDSQRVLNYALSRDIEDGALSPSPAVWMTDKQAEGNDYSTMNTDRDPVRLYNTDPEAPPPFQTGGPVASQGLQTTIANVQQMILSSSNTYSAQQGNAMAQQSGIAGQQQIDQGNIGNIKWFKDLEVMITQVGVILVNAIPRVYDATRQARILEEDGSSKIVTLNQTIYDQQTGTYVTLNDLSIGEYDVVCEMGPAFHSAQKESARSFEAMAAVKPELADVGMDIWLSNKQEPGMDLMAERFRVMLFNNGMIPESQWTDEEREQVAAAQAAAANQPPKEDPAMVLAQAEMGKAQAEMMNAQNKQAEIQSAQQIKIAEIQLEQQRLELDAQKFLKGQDDKFNLEAAKISQGQQKIDLQAAKQQFDAMMQQMKQQQEELNSAFNNLKTMREAMGVDSVVGPESVKVYSEQVDEVDNKQDSSNE